MSLEDDLPVNTVIGIDSAVFIYFIEEHPIYAPLWSVARRTSSPTTCA